MQNAAQLVFSPPLGNSLNIIEKIEGLLLVDTNFAPINQRQSEAGKKKKTVMSASSTCHGGQSV